MEKTVTGKIVNAYIKLTRMTLEIIDSIEDEEEKIKWVNIIITLILQEEEKNRSPFWNQ